MPVVHEEMQGSPKEFRDFNGFRHVRKLLVDWDLRIALMNELLLAGGQIYPYDPATLSRAKEASAVPFGGIQELGVIGFARAGTPTGSGAIATYEKAIVTVVYKTPQPGDPAENPAGDLISESLEPTAEFLTLDHTPFRWDGGDHLNEQEAPGRQIKMLDYVFTRHDIDTVPLQALQLLGKVNQIDLVANFLGVIFRAETLLYNPPTIFRRIDTQGNAKLTVTYRFTYKVEGWNVFWRSKSQEFEEIFLAGDVFPYKNYPTGDFTVL